MAYHSGARSHWQRRRTVTKRRARMNKQADRFRHLPQPMVEPRLRRQLGMVPLLFDPPFVDDDEVVDEADRCQAVGPQGQCTLPRQLLDRRAA